MAKTTSRTLSVRVLLIWTSATVGVIAVSVLMFSGAMVAYARLYENRIFPGTRILSVRLDGMTVTEARTAVQHAIDQSLADGVRFRYDGKEIGVGPSTTAEDPDVSHDLVHYDIDTAVQRAYALGRSGRWGQDVFQQLGLRISPTNVETPITIDTQGVMSALDASFATDLHPPQDAHLIFDASSTPPSVSVQHEMDGVVLDTDAALARLRLEAKVLQFDPITLTDKHVAASIHATDIEPLVSRAEEVLHRPPLVFTTGDVSYPVPTSTLVSWLAATGTPGAMDVVIDPDKFATGIVALTGDLQTPAKNGGLTVQDGKIVSFTHGTEGREIDTAATLADVDAHWPASSTFPIILHTTQGTLVGDDPQRMGITDLLGVGTSNFLRSPANRIKNIQHGVAIMNGTIIQPGDTFSLIKTLGEIDGAHGWLPELVIKGNETLPEFGGGLCQIGTTTFRAALASGLPITERQNHSYRVVYYEPAGTDATIYDPQPDLRFTNDTGHPVFINAYIKGSIVTFEFWGTRDGRTESYSGIKTVTNVSDLIPRVYNVTQPPPVRLVETLDLPPGKKRCTESAHAGADADFTYDVTYPDGTVKTQDFHSHYKPWQAVCLVGVDKISTPDATSTAMATP